MIRQPAVAGKFYAGNGPQLLTELATLTTRADTREKVLGVIAPHAGYVYSGAVAGKLYGRIHLPATIIILGPNHRGVGAATALYPEGSWLTPLGSVLINAPLSQLILKHSPLVEEDPRAHSLEHSLEVQVPFLQFIRPDVTIVPLCLGFNDFESCRSLGQSLAGAVREYGEETLIVASSDMTHYESAASARLKDELALKEVLDLNPEGLVQVCRTRQISMCGVIPAAVMLVAALELGATQAELVRYATSGDVTGDDQQVVGYAGVAVA